MPSSKDRFRLSRRSTALLLMGASMALLLVFQALWLRKVYDERKGWLQKETETLFQQAVRNMQDSIINIRILAPLDEAGKDVDTSVILALQDVMRLDMTRSRTATTLRLKDFDGADTMKRTLSIKEVRIDIGDSVKVTPHMFDQKKTFFFSRTSHDSLQLSPAGTHWTTTVDTIPLADLQLRYEQLLRDSGIGLAVQVVQEPFQPTLQPSPKAIKDGRLITMPVPAGLPPRSVYYASIGSYSGYLFQEILPEAVFSLVLLLVTGLAFAFIYRSLRQQQRLAALKNDFISNVAHELKTPIATVGVAIESLRNFDALREPERTAEYLDISKHELNRLSLLVDKVLKMAIFEQKEPDLHLEQLDFRGLVQEVLNSMKLQFEKYGTVTTFTCEGDDFDTEGDRIHLTNVVYNLLDNTLKYSEDTPVIAIAIHATPQHMELVVSDQGIGIPPEYVGRVFEKFFRVPTGDRHNVKGYGLGLSYVAGVVAKHGGNIRVESTPGKGSRFIIHIPRKHGKNENPVRRG